jgi:hypothetical protein
MALACKKGPAPVKICCDASKDSLKNTTSATSMKTLAAAKRTMKA